MGGFDERSGWFQPYIFFGAGAYRVKEDKYNQLALFIGRGSERGLCGAASVSVWKLICNSCSWKRRLRSSCR
jgi:hypothetical protein